MSGPKNIHWTPARQALLDEARRILGTGSDSETIAACMEVVVTRGVPALDPEEIRVKARGQGLYIVSYDHRAVGRIVNRDMKGRWYLTAPMDKPRDLGEVTGILHRGAELREYIVKALGGGQGGEE